MVLRIKFSVNWQSNSLKKNRQEKAAGWVFNKTARKKPPDELIGGFDEVKGKKIRIEGYLEEFSLSREEADQLIMSAREIAFK